MTADEERDLQMEATDHVSDLVLLHTVPDSDQTITLLKGSFTKLGL